MLKLPVKLVNTVVNAILGLLSLLKLDTPNRVVVALTPVFTLASGFIFALVAKYVPFLGNSLTKGELIAVFTVGAIVAATHTLSWLKGWQAYEKNETEKTVSLGFPAILHAVEHVGSEAIASAAVEVEPAIKQAATDTAAQITRL